MLRTDDISGVALGRLLLVLVLIAGMILCGVSAWAVAPVEGAEKTLTVSDMPPSVMAAGYNHSLLVTSDGTLWAWGWNRYGQLGLGDISDRLAPTPVGTATDWVAVATGWHHSLALRSDGTLWAWGRNEYGQLGLGYVSEYELEPRQVVVGNDWVAVSSGRYHTLGIRSDGTLWAWGRNNNGQLGLGTAVPLYYAPQKVGSLSDWASIACGDEHSLAIRSNGTLWAWGNNSDAELGLGHQSNDGNGVPQRVGSGTDWATVASDYCYSMGIKKDGSLWAWGCGYQGQLGLGSDTSIRKVPTRVGTDSWAGVYPGRVHCLGVRSDGTMWAWGQNYEGELGLGESDKGVTKTSPQMVLGSATNWVMGASGDAFSVGLRSDGTAWGWGRNGEGQLGVNDRTARYEPTPCISSGDYPLTVGTQAASGILENGATLNGSLIGMGDASAVQLYFEWGLTTDYGNTTAAQTKTATGPFSASLTGMAAETTYYYRARAYANGESVYGNGRSFSTAATGTIPPAPGTTPPAVTTGGAQSVGVTTVSLSGNLTSMGTAGSVVVSFEYGTAAGSFTQRTDGKTLGAAGVFDTELTGLAAGTTYYYRARADGDGTVYGAELTFTTAAAPVATLAVETLDADALTAGSARLNGNLASLGTVGSVTVLFQWGGVSGSYPSETAAVVMTGAGSFNCDLGDLASGTTYYYRAKAMGNGTSYGVEKTFATSEASAPAVTTSNAGDVTAVSAILNGNLSSMGTAGSAAVSFEWGTHAGGPYPNVTDIQTKTGVGAFSATLTGLVPATTYYYRSAAVGDGTGHGAEQSFTTGRGVQVNNVDAGSGKRNQHLTVTISGSNLDGATAISFGSGIAVEDFTVKSNTEIAAEIAVDGDAGIGPRDVSVTTGLGTGTMADGFEIVGAAGGFCSRASAQTPTVAGEVVTTMVALGVVLGSGYWLVRGRARGKRP